ncbi:MAG: CDP-diacylglycerol--glycerol-3-phosphate 3-phosphatidyltransferase [Alphaproteobacteria bacterium]|nr:CDP-diacylglycerol--glycerol-3-phosphate 3-phosphatidyltransferase [Alphaproteobacteria bacterium SS10]
MWTLPNILTIGRMVAMIPLGLALAYGGENGAWIAFALFCLMSVSDFLDGWIARRFNMASAFGRVMDPIADKVVVGVMLPLLIGMGLIEGWHTLAVYLILTREFVISGLREFLAGSLVIHVTTLAKWKTTMQLVATGAILLSAAWTPATLSAIGLLWVAALMTVVTGIDYLRQAWPSLSGDEAAS